MKKFTGIVTEKSGDKTVKVLIERVKVHPRYGKRYRVHRGFLAHDESNTKKIGDKVIIIETRPLAKRKHFKIVG